MRRQFTENQRQAITLRDKNILVSAAAGSGKTAVLVERIIRMISEGEHPADIDRLLIVTFTSAAAGEMRERITAAISEKLAAEPENEHLQRQSALIHNAQITTIHSFCLFVIRNHFQEIGLDPAFRVADEGEIGLLMQDVLEDVLEEAFGELERAKEQAAFEEKRAVEKKEVSGNPERAGEEKEAPADREQSESAIQREAFAGKEEKRAEGQGREFPFQRLVEAYSTGKKETVLEESILSLYRFAISYPWPQEWLKEHGEDYEFSSVEELEQAPFMKYLMEYVENMLPELAGQLKDCIRICEEPDGPYMYGENLEKSFEALERAAQAEHFAGCREALWRVEFDRLPAKKDASVNPEKREAVKQARNSVKKQLEQIREQFFLLDEDVVFSQCRRVSPLVRELAALTARFGERFAEKKREKNIIDFSDMEHLALDILCRHKEGEAGAFVEPTAAALELKEYFQEIMIDEYQDSNLVQECILSCISGEDAGRFNRFMVGDVKQSIYKFRLARPELFMEKFYDYSGGKDHCQRIDLRKNFRSRPEVIDSVNLIFSQLLSRNLGGIDYDENAELHYGAVYYDEAEGGTERERESAGDCGEDNGKIKEEQERKSTRTEKNDKIAHVIDAEREKNRTEFLIIEKSEEDDRSSAEQEAECIALRIRRLMREMEVLDQDSGRMRPLRYGDIVILLRSSSGVDEIFQEVMERQDIPCYISSRTGYFQTSEVQVILQFLRVLDNPLQDIPLFGVLKSCFASFTDREAAQIVAAFPGRQKLYRKLQGYAALSEERPGGFPGSASAESIGGFSGGHPEDFLSGYSGNVSEEHTGGGSEGYSEEFPDRGAGQFSEELSRKCRRFLEQIEELRRCSVYLSVRELLAKIMEESRYLEYVTALPGGRQRRANAQMLLQKAAAFEKTSFKGLYHFIRYIDQMEKYSIDYGEAGVQDELADVVRIMTVHKSKGLEFPVCFASGMGRKMNRRDASGAVLTDMDMGIAVDLVDPVLRVKQKTLRKAVLSRKIQLDSQAEELRILYVALTRAKEKLIITGVTDDAAKLLRGKTGILGHESVALPYSVRSGAGSFLELLIACVMRKEGMEELFRQVQIETEPPAILLDDKIRCEIMEKASIHADLKEESELTKNDIKSFKMKLQFCASDKKVKEYLQKRFGYNYPHWNLQGLYAKTTVSELKMAAIRNLAGRGSEELLDGEEGGHLLFEEETPAPYLPLFLRKQEEDKISGAARGSAMHRVMELMDFGKLSGGKPEEAERAVGIEEKPESTERSAEIKEKPKEEMKRCAEEPGLPEKGEVSGAVRYDMGQLGAVMEAWCASGLLSEEYRAAVSRKRVLHFMNGSLAERMHTAAKAGLLWKEQPFMLGISADRLSEEFPETEQILVQGIIDAFFEEDGEIVLLDYKTDVIESPGELADRYRVQLDYYGEALERMTGKRVKERILYSFYLGEEVRV